MRLERAVVSGRARGVGGAGERGAGVVIGGDRARPARGDGDQREEETGCRAPREDHRLRERARAIASAANAEAASREGKLSWRLLLSPMWQLHPALSGSPLDPDPP